MTPACASISGCDVVQALVVALMVVMPDEGGDVPRMTVEKFEEAKFLVSSNMIEAQLESTEDESIITARCILPFMMNNLLWAVVTPNSNVEAEILGEDFARLLMMFVEINPEAPSRIPLWVISEMMSNPQVSGHNPVVKGLLDALDVNLA